MVPLQLECACVEDSCMYFIVLWHCIILCIPIVSYITSQAYWYLKNYLLGSQTSVTVTRGPTPPPYATPSNNIKMNAVALYERITVCVCDVRHIQLRCTL